MSMLKKINLKHFEVVPSHKILDGYSIEATYEVIDEYGNVDLLTITDLPLSINRFTSPIISHNLCMDGNAYFTYDFGFGELESDRFTKVDTKRIYTAEKEMTIEEIEKKLGYKVKIVSKEN